MAEDHGLCDGKTPINIAKSGELVLLLLADHIELLDGVQSLLLALQLNDVGQQHLTVLWFLAPCQEMLVLLYWGLPLNPDALVLMSLGGDHDVRLVQNKHADLLWVKELQLEAPVKDGARRSDHDVLLDVLSAIFKWIDASEISFWNIF
uniref:Uncharacterized protein n=1 Tax=Gadus morhua TaxID=8049 RepID=A0A8C5CX34_GADMO